MRGRQHLLLPASFLLGPPLLVPPHFFTSFGFFFSEQQERVRKEEEKGVTAAAALFLDTILLLEAEGWLRGFLDALVAAGLFPLASEGFLPFSFPLPEPQPPLSRAALCNRDPSSSGFCRRVLSIR